MGYKKVQTPRGVKDILPREADIKSRLERRAADYVEKWSYARVVTPTFEYDDALAVGDPSAMGDHLYRFVDRDGATLALRHELTTPIARLVATRYHTDDMPLRLYYIGSVFRHDEPQAGRHREFTQVGIELLGAKSRRADAEVVTLAAGLMDELGIKSCRLDLGHASLFLGIVDGTSDPTVVKQLRQALLDRDYVRYETMVGESPLSPAQKQALKSLPVLRGTTDIIAEGRKLVKDMPMAMHALDELEAVARLAKAYGLGDKVGIDLGMVKNLDYYTGIQIEGYVPELGFTLYTGGRYDHLIGRYGRDCPAVGFAFGVERAMLALDRQGQNGQPPAIIDVFLRGDEADETALFQAASELRARGLTVEIDVAGSQPASAGSTNRRGDRVLINANVSSSDGSLQFTVDSDRSTYLSLEDLFALARQTEGSTAAKGEPT